MTGEQSSNLPNGWIEAPLEKFCVIIQGQSPPGHTYNSNGEGLPFFQGKAEFGQLYPTPVKWCTAPSKIAERDDILISIRAPVGPTNLSPSTSCIGRGLAAIRPLGGMNPRYILYGLRSTAQKLLDESTGSTFDAISGQTLREHSLAFAPLAEQERIVAEIEKQFTRLDAAVAALKRIQANLKRYRAAVLKAACEGRLVPTEAELARRGGRSYEPASALLERILADRRSRWQAAQLAKFQAAGKALKDNKWKSKYEEPILPDPALSKLPEGWLWATLSQVSWNASYGTSEKCDYDWPGPAVLRIPNVASGKIDLTDMKHAHKSHEFDESDAITIGDMLIVRTNGSRDLIGRSAVVQQSFGKPHLYASYLIRFRLIGRLPLLAWMRTIWDSPWNRAQIENLAATTAGQYNVSVGKLNPLPIPLPPADEMQRIATEIDRRTSVIDELEAQVGANLLRAERLRQSILKRAFEGKLVPQEPNDEPASALLERIRGTAIPGCALPDKKQSNTSRKGRAALSKEEKHTAKNGCATKTK